MPPILHDVSILLLVTLLIGISIGFLSPVSFQAMFSPVWYAAFQCFFFFGTILGAGIWTGLYHQQARISSMQFACLLSFLGWMCVWACASDQLGTRLSVGLLFSVGRAITGCACALLLCAVSVHLFEIAPNAWIGTFGCLPWLGLIGGICITQIVIHVLFWRVLALANAVLAVVLHFLLYRVPESDKWLGITSEQSDVQPLLGSDESFAECDTRNSVPDQDVAFARPCRSVINGSWPRTQTCTRAMWLVLFQQLTGAQVLLYFSEVLYQFNPDHWLLGYGWIVGLPQLLCGSLAALLSNRIALVHLLRGSAAGLTVVHFTLGYLLSRPRLEPINNLAIGCIVLGLAVHALAWGPIPLLVVNGSARTEERGRAMGRAMLVSWLANLCMTMLFEPLITVLGVASYFRLLSALGLLAACSVPCLLADVVGPDGHPTFGLKVPARPRLNVELQHLGRAFQLDARGMLALGRRRILWCNRLKGV